MVVTIKRIVPLFKKEEEARAIELIELEEVGFKIVAQKGLYNLGDKAILVEPDFNLPDNPLFESYLRPQGDKKKSKLGKNNRVKAIKFGLHTGDGINVFSYGILLPLEIVSKFCSGKDLSLPIYEQIGVFKEVEEVSIKTKKESTRSFPIGLYKTDETNINKLWNHIEFPIKLYPEEKVDGSSISFGIKNGERFVCSRNLELPIIVKAFQRRREKTFLEKLLFWTKPDLNIYADRVNTSEFVQAALPYLQTMVNHGLNNMVFRGELYGWGMKGSGNPLNPHAKESRGILIFGVDEWEGDTAVKLDIFSKRFVCKQYKIPMVKSLSPVIFNNREEVEHYANEYFKSNVIEGLVFKTEDSKFSAKFMNLYYDSKK